MATEFPQPQMDPMEGPEDQEGATVDLLDEIGTEVEETEDGGAIIKIKNDVKGPMEGDDFYGNMAEWYDEHELDKLANRYLELIEKDHDAREDRDKQYEEGLRRTGLGNDAPGGAQINGANKVVHPVMAEACVDFESRAIKELQEIAGSVPDGKLGPATLAAVKVKGERTVYYALLQRRFRFWAGLARANPKKYGDDLAGWVNRGSAFVKDI
jgi:hypothetical protein